MKTRQAADSFQPSIRGRTAPHISLPVVWSPRDIFSQPFLMTPGSPRSDECAARSRSGPAGVNQLLGLSPGRVSHRENRRAVGSGSDTLCQGAEPIPIRADSHIRGNV
ncbi:hypothetical protein DPEC_G00137450 [Dallia pectoralis]|uniref:Uncharacterized protein n=1 Tax=Dallia pectoralis TaxID=75939 RepID=A0ACC2GM08_DALPE|nr:hypothetical protein DPEC_G00137450 [Dallia pectoralis]